MDAPPPQEDVRPFVQVAQLIREAGLNGPQVLESDAEQGFLLLSDLGRELYLRRAAAGRARPRADALMRDAITALVQWQLQRADARRCRPTTRRCCARELALFPEWCVQREFGLHWGDGRARAAGRALPPARSTARWRSRTVAVHRDWMPRNLMVAEPNPGILDFQDAVRGPITYDVASLLRDAFISWDEEQRDRLGGALLEPGQARRRAAGRWRWPPTSASSGAQLEWMGLQRHLKVLGIFCRLKHRDGKPALCRGPAALLRLCHQGGDALLRRCARC